MGVNREIKFGDERLPDRFWKKVTVNPNGCWEWAGLIDAAGYGSVGHNRKKWRAHRLIVSIREELIPGMTVDHLCRVRHCVNPEHLEQVTSGENTRRGYGNAGINSRVTHCLFGHELVGDNLAPRANGRRRCRVCCQRRAAEQLARGRRRSPSVVAPKRIQLSSEPGWRKPAGAIGVARPSIFGNPFRGKDAVQMFNEWARKDGNYQLLVRDQLRGHDLACWCPVDSPCHADMLLEIANA